MRCYIGSKKNGLILQCNFSLLRPAFVLISQSYPTLMLCDNIIHWEVKIYECKPAKNRVLQALIVEQNFFWRTSQRFDYKTRYYIVNVFFVRISD